MLVGINVSFNSLKYNLINEAITGRSILSSSKSIVSPNKIWLYIIIIIIDYYYIIIQKW